MKPMDIQLFQEYWDRLEEYLQFSHSFDDWPDAKRDPAMLDWGSTYFDTWVYNGRQMTGMRKLGSS